MENMIYNDLIRRGYSVDVGIVELTRIIEGRRRSSQYKIDFVVNVGNDGYVFQLAENVCELHTDELGILLPDQPDDVLLGVVTHEPDSFPMVTVYGRGAPLREKF